MKFALITEGPSEHRIIRGIIARCFKDHDPQINQIQPKLIDGKQDRHSPGGWNEVLKYCERPEIDDILIENDYLVIQIDTDQSQTAPFSVNHTHSGSVLKTPAELYKEVVEKLQKLINEKRWNQYRSRIFFAICIHTIECWLLPIYHSNGHAQKTVNCIDRLNDALRRNNIYPIPNTNKNEGNGVRAYETILRNWKRKEDIIKSAEYQYSLGKFMEQLGTVLNAET